MLCCIGLFGGLSVGQSLGGHWTITAPAVGFGLGLYGDMKLMRGMHGQNPQDSNHKSKMSVATPLPSGKKRKICYYKALISTQKRSGGTVVSKTTGFSCTKPRCWEQLRIAMISNYSTDAP